MCTAYFPSSSREGSAQPPECRPSPLDAEPPPPGCRPLPDHVTCDACWEANPPVDRQTPVKTLPCHKPRLRSVKIILIDNH